MPQPEDNDKKPYWTYVDGQFTAQHAKDSTAIKFAQSLANRQNIVQIYFHIKAHGERRTLKHQWDRGRKTR